MPMIGCRVVETTPSGNERVVELHDRRGMFSITTHLRAPYRTILKDGYEMIAAQTHDTLRAAIRFHRSSAATMHEPRIVIAEPELAQ